jgi:hypothetical protein
MKTQMNLGEVVAGELQLVQFNFILNHLTNVTFDVMLRFVTQGC